MAFLRAYSMRSAGVVQGRTARMGDPFIGAILGAGLPIAKKLAGKAIGKLTGGRLLGKGGGAAAVRKVVGGGAVIGGGFAAEKGVRKIADISFGGRQKKYRRMNPGNAKALRRAFRRIDAFTKLAAKAGYVRRPRPKARS